MAAGSLVLPTGTVTFLLTDVQGSSRLWETRADEMAAAVACHYAILDEAVTTHGGVRPVEQGEGDSVVAAFARAGDAVAAAVAAERRLISELPWLTVRMAIHTGEAQLRGEHNYVGSTIIRCARLRTCAHGGQIVLSSATTALVGDETAFDLVDLGTVRLRDLARPERVWQVVADGLRTDFGPLRSLDAVPHHLPSALTSFIGRDRELATVTGYLRQERVVTLTGAGGCGKTRLALHAALELVDSHPGGTWWVDLAPVAVGARVADTIAAALGAQPAPGSDAIALLARHTQELGPALVVLDNAEHLVDDVATVVDVLVRRCPDVRLLVTSREPLGIAGELVWRVPSLSAPTVGAVVPPEGLEAFEAARLFIDRASRVRPNLVIDDETATCIVAICAHLDGIPLALELAAARARTMPLSRLAAGLDDALRLLTSGVRADLPRQQTLQASIAWSVDLLDDVERAVLRRLSVFQGPFPLEAAEHVGADGELVDRQDVLDVISRLVDKSLVLLDERTDRYRLLETISQFAAGLLREAQELTPTFDRHAAWFADWCESLGRAEHDFDLDPTHPALPDVFAALDWAYEHDPTAVYRITSGLRGVRHLIGHYPEFDHQLRWLAARDGSDNPTGWAAAIAGIASISITLARFEYLALMERAEPLTDPADQVTRSWSRLFPATIAAFTGDHTELSELLARAEAAHDDHLIRLTATMLACARGFAGDFTVIERAVAAVRRVLDRQHLPFALHTALATLGLAVWMDMQRGDFDAARAMIERAGRPDGSNVFTVAACVSILGYACGDAELLHLAGSWQAAAAAGLTARHEHTEEIDLLEGSALGHACWSALFEGRSDEALVLLRRCWATTPLTPGLKSFQSVPLAVLLLRAGAQDELGAHLDVLAADVARVGDPPLSLAHLTYLRALQACDRERVDEAWGYAHEALAIAHRNDLRLVTIDALNLLAQLAHRRGHPAVAARLFGAVATERARIGYVAREVPDPAAVDAVEAEVRSIEPTAWTEGTELDLMGAVAYVQRSRGERSRPTIGWASLSPTEQRVAALVAGGSTNNDVARELLMSLSTVKTHLTHIYAKVGVNNRTELSAHHPRS